MPIQRESGGEGEMSKSNRAIVFKNIGSWEDVLQLVLLPKPQICPGHVLVRVILRPIHDFDIAVCSDRGLADISFDIENNSDSFRSRGIIAGLDGGLGIIEEVGEGVASCRLGERVHLLTLHAYYAAQLEGSWQDYVLIKGEYALPVPDTITDEVAGQFSGNPWTVYGLSQEIDVPKGEYVVITAAGSVIGRLFIQLAKHEGRFKTIAIVRREDLKEELLALGAEAVINSSLEDVIQRVREITDGRGAYLGLDLVGGNLTKAIAASVRDVGQLMVIGSVGGLDLQISLKDLWRNVRISAWQADSYFLEREKVEAATKACWKYFEEGIWKLPPPLKFDLSDFKQALHESQKAGRSGKVMLESK